MMTENNIGLLHWNINQKHMSNTPKMIVDEIFRLDSIPGVIVLTEFYKTPNSYENLIHKLEEKGYRVFMDSRTAKKSIRQVLVAINSKLLINQIVKITELPDNEGNIRWGEYPNFIRVDFEYNHMPITIIGTRIRVLYSGGEEEQQRRKKQFQTLLGQLPEKRALIVLGDFNISNHEDYKKMNSKWHFEKDYHQALKDRNLKLFIPEGDQHSPVLSKYKLDHLIVNKYVVILKPPQYITDFKLNNGGNYPDHAILTAEIMINDVR